MQHILHQMNNDDVYEGLKVKKQRIMSLLLHVLMQQAHTRFLLLRLVRQPSLAAFDSALMPCHITLKNAWNDHILGKWWFHVVFLPSLRNRTSRKIILTADNFGSHDTTDTGLQDQQVEWVLLPPNRTSVHQPMDQGIIATLKRITNQRCCMQWLKALKCMM